MALSLAGLSRKVERAARSAAQRAKRQEAAIKRHEKKLAELERKKLDRAAKAFISKDNQRRKKFDRAAKAFISKDNQRRKLEREADRRDEREAYRNSD